MPVGRAQASRGDASDIAETDDGDGATLAEGRWCHDLTSSCERHDFLGNPAPRVLAEIAGYAGFRTARCRRGSFGELQRSDAVSALEMFGQRALIAKAGRDGGVGDGVAEAETAAGRIQPDIGEVNMRGGSDLRLNSPINWKIDRPAAAARSPSRRFSANRSRTRSTTCGPGRDRGARARCDRRRCRAGRTDRRRRRSGVRARGNDRRPLRAPDGAMQSRAPDRHPKKCCW